MSTLLETPIRSVSQIDWDTATFVGQGISARTYHVAPETVVRISWYTSDRMIYRQQFLAERGLALPIYDYSLRYFPPLEIRQFHCHAHRPGYEASQEQYTWKCTCDDFLSAILMPEAEFDPSYWEPDFVLPGPAARFLNRVQHICNTELDYWWDAHYGNTCIWHGHRYAIDFE